MNTSMTELILRAMHDENTSTTFIFRPGTVWGRHLDDALVEVRTRRVAS